MVKITKKLKEEVVHFFLNNNDNTMPTIRDKFGINYYHIVKIIKEYFKK